MALTAKTGEGQLAGVDMAAGTTGTEFCGDRDLMHIHDCITAVANEVNVRLRIGIKAFYTIDGCYAGNAPLLFEEGQISVDCCLRDIRMCFL